jgi:hypothetical protein
MAEINFDLSNLTRADLEQKLGPPACNEAVGEATSLKWMLSGEPFFLSASFLVFGQEIESCRVPSTLILHGPPMTSLSNIKLAGIRPGDSEDHVKKLFEKEERTFLPGYKRIKWDENWVVQWLVVRGKISMIICVNEGLIGRTWDERKQGHEFPSASADLS